MILYRAPRRDEAAALATLGRETFVETFGHLYRPEDLAQFLDTIYAEDVIARQLDSDRILFRVAEAAGQLVGYCKLGLDVSLDYDPGDKTVIELKQLYVFASHHGSGAGQAIANASRSTNVIRYVSPSFSGLTLTGNYSTSYSGTEGAVGDAGKGKAVHLAANYVNGPITAGLSVWDATGEEQTATAARTGQKANTLAVGYDFGVAKVGLTYDQSTQRAAAASAAFVDTKRTAYSIPVVVPAGNGAFLVTYTKAANTKTAGVTNDNTGATLWSVGYDYDLSKRTKLGVSYAALNNKSAAGYGLYTQASLAAHGANAVGQNATRLYAGVRHAF